MLVHRETPALLLCGLCLLSMQADGRVSSKVIALQQDLYDELQALERGALITNLVHASLGGGAFGQLRKVFHEFERQNQESITAVLRVLALVDHTLENTIKDCAKIFDLPSLESENILFRHVTRPLVTRVAELCEQIASEQLAGLEATMEAVENEANDYRKRLDATREDMGTILKQLDKMPDTVSMKTVLAEPFNRLQLRALNIERRIDGAVQNISHRQGLLRSSMIDATSRQAVPDSQDADMIISFMEGMENETSVLADDLAEELQAWNNETEDTVRLIAEEVEAIVHNLFESPITAYLEREKSLKCVAEYYNYDAFRDMAAGLGSIFDCFAAEGALVKPLDIIERLLQHVETDVETVLEGILECIRDDDTDAPVSSEVPSCFEAIEPILNVTEEFVETKMNEIFFHLEDAVNFENLKLETCLYYKARKLAVSEQQLDHNYRTCNGAEEPPLPTPSDNSEYISV